MKTNRKKTKIAKLKTQNNKMKIKNNKKGKRKKDLLKI